MADVYAEFDEIRRRSNIKEFESCSVDRQYAFEIAGIPLESEYLKVAYPFTEPALSTKLKGKTFSHVFGTNSNALELFLLKRKLMGPCWIEIKDAALRIPKVLLKKTDFIDFMVST
jgi:DNA polymerase alpha subunit A